VGHCEEDIRRLGPFASCPLQVPLPRDEIKRVRLEGSALDEEESRLLEEENRRMDEEIAHESGLTLEQFYDELDAENEEIMGPIKKRKGANGAAQSLRPQFKLLYVWEEMRLHINFHKEYVNHEGEIVW
jgi:hypothetical protein